MLGRLGAHGGERHARSRVRGAVAAVLVQQVGIGDDDAGGQRVDQLDERHVHGASSV